MSTTPSRIQAFTRPDPDVVGQVEWQVVLDTNVSSSGVSPDQQTATQTALEQVQLLTESTFPWTPVVLP